MSSTEENNLSAIEIDESSFRRRRGRRLRTVIAIYDRDGGCRYVYCQNLMEGSIADAANVNHRRNFHQTGTGREACCVICM